MHWVRANSADFGGTLPQPRRSVFVHPPFASNFLFWRSRCLIADLVLNCSGHSAVNVGKSLVVVFGGLVDKRFISDIAVYDVGTFLNFFLGNSFFCSKKSYRLLEISFCFCFGYTLIPLRRTLGRYF